jgi:hypothetical protein
MLHMFKRFLDEFEEGDTSSDPTQALSRNPNPRSDVAQASTGDDNNR